MEEDQRSEQKSSMPIRGLSHMDITLASSFSVTRLGNVFQHVMSMFNCETTVLTN